MYFAAKFFLVKNAYWLILIWRHRRNFAKRTRDPQKLQKRLSFRGFYCVGCWLICK
jgi:hypothetical protein